VLIAAHCTPHYYYTHRLGIKGIVYYYLTIITQGTHEQYFLLLPIKVAPLNHRSLTYALKRINV